MRLNVDALSINDLYSSFSHVITSYIPEMSRSYEYVLMVL
jgi:hypothetical protein